MNSKTGLYPLYVAYSIYVEKCKEYPALTIDKKNAIWRDTLANNIFVICKTPMAKEITRRTLAGYKNYKVNAHYFEDLVNMLEHKQRQFIDKITRPNYWERKDKKKMEFDAIVGNPPYQLQGGSGGKNDAPIYQHFAKTAEELNPNYISLIIPARWFSAGRENLLGEFRTNMLKNKHLRILNTYTDSHALFPNVEIKGGICYYLLDKSYDGKCEYSLIENEQKKTILRNLDDFDIIIREPELVDILEKIRESKDYVDKIISNDTPFGISSNPRTSKKNPMEIHENESSEHNTKVYHIEKMKRKVEYIDRRLITKNVKDIDKFKVFIPGASGSGNDSYVLGKPEYAPKNSVCSQSYLYAPFDSEEEAKNFIKYLNTKFFRVIVSAIKISQSAPNRVYKFVPMQDFTNQSDIDWNKSVEDIDKQLYKKYKLNEEEIKYIENKIKYAE